MKLKNYLKKSAIKILNLNKNLKGWMRKLKKIISFMIILTMLVITGCSNKEVIKHDYTYKGENESWTAEYKVNGETTFIEKNNVTKCDNEANKVLTVTYKNDISELSSVKNIEISYKSSASAGNISSNYDDEDSVKKTYTMQSSSKNGAIEKQDEVIEVTINIDGNIEVLELKNE